MITPDFFVIIADVSLGLGNFVVRLCKWTTPTGGSLFAALLPVVRHRFLSVSFDFRCLTEEMAVLEFFGCAFIAFGPPLAMFAFTIAKDPIRIIILIARFVTAFLVFWFSCKHISATAIKSGELSYVILYAVRFLVAFAAAVLSSVDDCRSTQWPHRCGDCVFRAVSGTLTLLHLPILLRRAEAGLKKLTDSDTEIISNKNILAMVTC